MTRKKAFFTGLSFGLSMTVWYIISPWILREGNEVMNWTKNIVTGIISGLFAGFFFGLIMYWFANSKWVKPKTNPDLGTGEIILFETGANHFKGMEGVGGQLYLTNSKLIFKSHRFNIRNHELTIPLSDIVDVSRYKTTFITNNGLKITTTAGNTEKFVVDNAAEWSNRLIAGQIGVTSA